MLLDPDRLADDNRSDSSLQFVARKRSTSTMRCLRYLWIPTNDDRMIGAIAKCQMSINVAGRRRISTWARIDWRRRPGVASHRRRCHHRRRRLSRSARQHFRATSWNVRRATGCLPEFPHHHESRMLARAREGLEVGEGEREGARKRGRERERESARGDSTLSLPGKILSRARCLRPTPNSQPSSISFYSTSVTALAVLVLSIRFSYSLSFSLPVTLLFAVFSWPSVSRLRVCRNLLAQVLCRSIACRRIWRHGALITACLYHATWYY